jgi:hypothetical protein
VVYENRRHPLNEFDVLVFEKLAERDPALAREVLFARARNAWGVT